MNHELSEAALRMAVLHRGRGGYLDAVRAILLGYAGRYAGYALVPREGKNPGIATYTTLDESVWIVPLAWSFSLIEGELSGDERAQIIEACLYPPQSI